MKNKLSKKKLISYAILALMLIFIGKYVAENPEILSKLGEISILDFFYLSIFVILVLVFNGIRAKVLTEIFTGNKLHPKEWFGLSMINTLGNYSPMQGGFVARGYYLKNYYKVPYGHFASSILASTLLTFSSYSMISALAIGIYYLSTGTLYLAPAMFFLAIAITGLAIVFFLPEIKRIKRKEGFFWSKIDSFVDGWDIIRSSKHCIPRLIAIDIVSLAIIAIRFYLAGQILGIGVNFVQAIIIAAMAMVTLLVNITPGAIGIREAIAGFSATLVGTSLTDGVLIASLERAVILFWVLLIGIPYSIYFARHLGRKSI